MDTRSQILSAAQTLIQSKGIEAVSFRELAKEVGIKSSSVHYYFPTKDDLFLELSSLYFDAFFNELERRSSSQVGVQKKLTALIELFQETLKNQRSCLCGILAMSKNKLSEESSQKIQSFFDEMQLWVHQTLSAEKTDQCLNLSILDFSRVLVASLQGALMIDLLGQTQTNLVSCKKFVESAF